MAGILRETDGGLGVITLNDPAGGNRLDPDTLAGLHQAVTGAIADPLVRVLLLRAVGPSFCLGMDLARLATSDLAAGDPRVSHAVDLYVRTLEAIHDSPRPVVALVNGAVRAGGVGLVSACDVVVASEESTFELGEGFFGIIPANVLPFLLTYRIPLQTARYLILTGRTLGGRDAALMGLVDEVYPAASLEKGVRELLKRMWRISPLAAAEAKSFSRTLLGASPEQGRALARAKLAELLGRAEVRDALRGFEEGEAPPWFQRFRAAAPLVLSGEGSGEGGAK